MIRILDVIINQSLVISDECLENCLAAIAEVAQKSKENTDILTNHTNALLQVGEFFRHPNTMIRIMSARIITAAKKQFKLPKLVKKELRWILMQMVSLFNAK